MDNYTLLGPIRRLQLQKETLIVGVRPDREYRTNSLLSVDSLVLTPEGVLTNVDGGWIVDRHHTSHPGNTRPSLDRMLSVGFTAHYAAMADHFEKATLGDAGENVIIETDEIVTEDQISAGLMIERPGGAIELKGAAVASPCVPFTRYMLGDPAADLDLVKPNRDFLRNGMRGYVMGLGHLAGAVAIELGDMVYLKS